VTSLVTAAPLLLAAAGLAHPHHLDASTAATWAGLHIALLPAFPLLTTGLVLPLRGKSRRDLSGALTVVAWVAAFLYAAYYTGLDAVAGIAAGTAVRHGATGAVPPLFATGDALGRAGAYALAVSALATCAVLLLHHGARTLPGAVVLLAACWSFTDSHIFWPRGVLTMLAFAVAFALLTAAAPTRRQARQGPADPSAGPDRSRRF
jgi:hypothetical protein